MKSFLVQQIFLYIQPIQDRNHISDILNDKIYMSVRLLLYKQSGNFFFYKYREAVVILLYRVLAVPRKAFSAECDYIHYLSIPLYTIS